MRIHLSVLCLDLTEVQKKALLLQVVSPETDPDRPRDKEWNASWEVQWGNGEKGREGEEALHSQLITLRLQSEVLLRNAGVGGGGKEDHTSEVSQLRARRLGYLSHHPLACY